MMSLLTKHKQGVKTTQFIRRMNLMLAWKEKKERKKQTKPTKETSKKQTNPPKHPKTH